MIPLFPLPVLLAAAAHAAAPHTPPDTMVSGNFVVYLLVSLISAIGIAWARVSGKKAGIAEATNNITLQAPVPEVPVRKVFGPVSWEIYNALEKRVDSHEKQLHDIRREAGERYVRLLETGQEREHRLSEQIDKVARDWHGRMDLQFGPQPRTPRKG